MAAIFTGLLMFDRSEDQALVKVMGGFVGWEAALYLSYELYSRCRQPGDLLPRSPGSVRERPGELKEHFQGRACVSVCLYVCACMCWCLCVCV